MRLLGVVVVGLLVLPGVAAQAFQDEVDVRTHTLTTFTASLDNAPAGNLVTRNVTWEPEYSYPATMHTIRAKISYTMQVPLSQNGVWRISVADEDGPVPDCEWAVETINPGGFLTGTLMVYPFYGIDCVFQVSTEGTPHEHTLYMNRTLLSGNPNAPTHETVSVLFESLDVVIVSQPTPFEVFAGLTAVEFLVVPLLAVAGLFLWTRQDLSVRLFGIFLVLFDMAMVFAFYRAASGGAWEGLFVVVFVLLLAAAWMCVELARDLGKARQARRGVQ